MNQFKFAYRRHCRRYASFVGDEVKVKSNRSFLLGASVGASVGVATALYAQHQFVPSKVRSRGKYGGPDDLRDATHALRKVLQQKQISEDESDLQQHGSSAWFPSHDEGSPNIVVYPNSTEDVQKIVRIASTYKIPVIAYGAGTSIEGQFTTSLGGICIDLSQMDSIVQIDQEDMTVTLQPGVGWQSLNLELETRKTGLLFPVDPGPGASIGGCVGTSCSGPNAARWGTMKDWVLCMTVVTIDGQVFRTRSKAKKSSTGYDLNHLFIGAEGTLGIVTEITLKLTPKPTHELVGSCSFTSPTDITQAVLLAQKAGVNAQCFELLDDTNMPAINRYGNFNYPEKPHLFFKLSGNSPRLLKQESALLSEICRSLGGGEFTVAKSDEEATAIWSARKNLLLACLSMPEAQGCTAKSTDVCVPVSKLPDLIRRFKARAKELGVIAPVIGHVADGNFHSLMIYNEQDTELMTKVSQLSDELLKMALDLEGSVSGEHGVGNQKRHYLATEYGDVGVELMQRIKDAFDRDGLLNPGKLLPESGRRA
ncbi:hypothetical protein BCR37DRAFT_347539 [Protomyces lactucae-debilis]|uniref:D-lactate dehydrogenase (cytochrome) n=1 Tax=Protomyces lactucae-debilis TaxID=2754530 RepID=A0A1Y2FDU0_PROLT|nr:uncharacterized protein BCR37DRAFT_347539 [Protomyces lactucae-debilis]ORY82089.1 hypothetical protein BCR37DRAFT_347539 [Protomyces lactucae-debilis]